MTSLEILLTDLIQHRHSGVLSVLIFNHLSQDELLNLIKTLIIRKNIEILRFLKENIPQEMFF